MKRPMAMSIVTDIFSRRNFESLYNWANSFVSDVSGNFVRTDSDIADISGNIISIDGRVDDLEQTASDHSGNIANLLEDVSGNHVWLHTIADPQNLGYALDDALALESNLNAPSTGTAPARANYHGSDTTGDFSLFKFLNSQTRYLQSAIQIPHSYIANSQMAWHVHFVSDSAIPEGETVIFKADIIYASRGAVFSSNETLTATYTSPAGGTAADTHCMTTDYAFTPTLGLSGFILARLYRDNTDTFTGDVYLLGSDYHIRKKSLGS